MKKSVVVTLGLLMALGMSVYAFAAEETSAQEGTVVVVKGASGEEETAAEEEVSTEEAASAEEETSAAEEPSGEALETILVQLGEDQEPLEIKNTAELDIVAASVEPTEEEGIVTITMVDSEGAQYQFLDVQPEILVDPELTKEGLFAGIHYTSLLSGEEKTVYQDGEVEYEEPVEQFAVDDVYIRAEPNGDSEILGVISRGDAIEVLGETGTHYLVKKEDVTGYSVRRCISEDEQEAIAAVKAEEAAREAIAAQQAAAAASQQSGVYEVKRQKFEDCDGSGHGYYLITYSDGSTATQEF